MPHPIQDEPSWKAMSEASAASNGEKSYSRPLLGIEIVYDLFGAKADGLAEVCMGFTFNTSLPVSELVAKTRDSLAMARYRMPSIACTIVTKEEGIYRRFWQYTTLQEGDNAHRQLSSWIDESLTIRRGAIDTEAFVAEMNQRRTPYVHADGHEQHIHFYLLVDDASARAGEVRAALFLHGGHILLDARPALRCLNLLFEWIVNSPPELAEAAWGTEWERLPAGPLTATGGPCDDFDTKGLELLQHAGGIMMDPTPTFSFTPARTTIAEPGKMTRFHKSFDAQTSSNILRACKKTGFTMQHLIDAALMLHAVEGVESRASNDIDVSKAHITLNPTTIAQENFLVPPHNTPSHFVAGLIVLPIRVMYSSIPPKTASKHDRLLAIMSLIKPQYDAYLSNKNTPHIMPAMLALAPEYPPSEPTAVGDPHSSIVSNLGKLDTFVQCSRTADKDGATLKIEKFDIGLRLKWLHLSFHTWMLNGCLHTAIQASDAWDGDALETYLDDFSENILHIVNQE